MCVCPWAVLSSIINCDGGVSSCRSASTYGMGISTGNQELEVVNSRGTVYSLWGWSWCTAQNHLSATKRRNRLVSHSNTACKLSWILAKYSIALHPFWRAQRVQRVRQRWTIDLTLDELSQSGVLLRWGQLAHLTKSQSFVRKRNRHRSRQTKSSSGKC